MSNPIIVHDQPAAETYSPAEGSPQSGCASRDAAPPVTPKRETITIERKDWLELPRNITLKRFVNTSRETHFIGQYRDDDALRHGNPNPRRIYRIKVAPWFYDATPGLPLGKLFTVEVSEDTKLLFTLNTERGRAVAEYLGVKALKAWLNYCGSQRRGKQSRRNHHKCCRANLRARKAAKLAAKKEAV